MTQQPYHDPDEATLAAARRIRIHRSVKYLPYAVIVLVLFGVFLGVKITSSSSSSLDTQQLPDRRYASLGCGAQIQGISVPSNGYELPALCRTVISVNFGAVRIFQGEGLKTFDMGAGMRSNPYIIQRVYPLEGWTNIDIITLQQGQATYGQDDYKRDHPPGLLSRYQ